MNIGKRSKWDDGKGDSTENAKSSGSIMSKDTFSSLVENFQSGSGLQVSASNINCSLYLFIDHSCSFYVLS